MVFEEIDSSLAQGVIPAGRDTAKLDKINS